MRPTFHSNTEDCTGNPVDEHGEALGRDLGRDELGGGEPHAEALDERHHPDGAPAPGHEVRLRAEPERAHPGALAGPAPGRPEPELVELPDGVDQHGGVGRRPRGDGSRVGGRGAVVQQELRNRRIGLARVTATEKRDVVAADGVVALRRRGIRR